MTVETFLSQHGIDLDACELQTSKSKNYHVKDDVTGESTETDTKVSYLQLPVAIIDDNLGVNQDYLVMSLLSRNAVFEGKLFVAECETTYDEANESYGIVRPRDVVHEDKKLLRRPVKA